MRLVFGIAAMALLLGTVVAVAQSESGYEVRVRAMRLVDGRTEFEVQQKQQGGGWSDSLFARNPRLLSEPVVDRWYSSAGVALELQQEASMQLVDEEVAESPSPEGVEVEAPWSPLGDTGGEIDIRIHYQVNPDLLTGSLTTIVETRANPVGQDFSYYDLTLTMLCVGGELYLLVWDSLGFEIKESESILFRLADGSTATEFWEGYYGDAHGYSPENDKAFIESLQGLDSAIFRVGGPENDAYEVNLAGFFDTPAQSNIDRCGTY